MPRLHEHVRKLARSVRYAHSARHYTPEFKNFRWWYPKKGYRIPEEGFKLHITAGKPEHAPLVLRAAGRILRQEGVAHKTRPTQASFEASLKTSQSGKLITAYPPNPHDLVRIAARLDTELMQRGLSHDSPLATPLTSRRIGQSGLVHYRLATNTDYFKGGDVRFDARLGRTTRKPIKDLRTPGLHNPVMGPDAVEEIARKRGMRVEGMDDFFWRAGHHLDHLISSSASSPQESKRLAVLHEKHRQFGNVITVHEESEAVTSPGFDSGSIQAAREDLIRERFGQLYNEIRKHGPITDSKGIKHTPSSMISQMREPIERPLIDGKVPESMVFTRFTNRGYAPRKLLRKALSDIGEA